MKRFCLTGIVVAVCIFLAGCHMGSSFHGSILSNADCFQLDYVLLNQRENSSFSLNPGDSIRVSISQEAGAVDILVGMDGQEPVYEGKNLTQSEFVLNILESGIYQVWVTGHNACGSVVFRVNA